MLTYRWLEQLPPEARFEFTGSHEKLITTHLFLQEEPVRWATIDYAREEIRGETNASFFRIRFDAPNCFTHQEAPCNR